MVEQAAQAAEPQGQMELPARPAAAAVVHQARVAQVEPETADAVRDM
jgi:hypothetical protein